VEKSHRFAQLKVEGEEREMFVLLLCLDFILIEELNAAEDTFRAEKSSDNSCRIVIPTRPYNTKAALLSLLSHPTGNFIRVVGHHSQISDHQKEVCDIFLLFLAEFFDVCLFFR
jgi:hypothetical protein